MDVRSNLHVSSPFASDIFLSIQSSSVGPPLHAHRPTSEKVCRKAPSARCEPTNNCRLRLVATAPRRRRARNHDGGCGRFRRKRPGFRPVRVETRPNSSNSSELDCRRKRALKKLTRRNRPSPARSVNSECRVERNSDTRNFRQGISVSEAATNGPAIPGFCVRRHAAAKPQGAGIALTSVIPLPKLAVPLQRTRSRFQLPRYHRAPRPDSDRQPLPVEECEYSSRRQDFARPQEDEPHRRAPP